MGTFIDDGRFVLTQPEYEEVLATVLAPQRLGVELEALYSQTAGPKNAATRGVAASVALATQRVLDILDFQGPRT